MRGNRLPLLVVALLTVAGVAFGGFRLQQELGKAQPAAQCIQDPKDLENPAEAGPPLCQPFPTPACSNDPKTGLPLPGSNQYCPPIALCETCPLPTIAPDVPTIDFGPFAPNPAAVLTSPPQHRVGDAVALGRTDCPAGWRALVSDTTGMSVCFPADIGRVTSGESGMTDPVTGVVRYEDRIEITLSGSNLPAVVTVNVVRSAGLSGPYWLDCAHPDFTPVLGLPAKTCVYPDGVSEAFESAVPLFISAHEIEKSGFQWVFAGVVWGVIGQPRPDTAALNRTILQMLSTLRLP